MLNINLEIDSSTWVGNPVPTELTALTNNLSFDILDLMLHVADATKNPNYLGRSLNDFWAFLRYSRCFVSIGNLRLISEFEDIDAHQKTILSDDIGMGMASLVMEEAFGVKALTDTSFFMKYINSLSTTSTGKKGPNKSPDFLVLDENLNIHILECKGTQSGIKNSNKQLDSGKSQKRSLNDPNSIISEKLVIGTFIAKSTGRNNSRVKIVDPDFKYNFEKMEKKEMKYLLLFSQLIKELSFVIKEGYLKLFPKEVLPEKIFEANEFFNKFKTTFLESELTLRNIDIIEEYPEIRVRKAFDFNFLKRRLGESENLIAFLDNFKTSKRKINEGTYTGIFGLELKILNG